MGTSEISHGVYQCFSLYKTQISEHSQTKHFQIEISRLQPENRFRFREKENRDYVLLHCLSFCYYDNYTHANKLRKRKGSFWLSIFQVLVHSDNGWESAVKPSWSLHRQGTNGQGARDQGLLSQPTYTLQWVGDLPVDQHFKGSISIQQLHSGSRLFKPHGSLGETQDVKLQRSHPNDLNNSSFFQVEKRFVKSSQSY